MDKCWLLSQNDFFKACASAHKPLRQFHNKLHRIYTSQLQIASSRKVAVSAALSSCLLIRSSRRRNWEHFLGGSRDSKELISYEKKKKETHYITIDQLCTDSSRVSFATSSREAPRRKKTRRALFKRVRSIWKMESSFPSKKRTHSSRSSLARSLARSPDEEETKELFVYLQAVVSGRRRLNLGVNLT